MSKKQDKKSKTKVTMNFTTMIPPTDSQKVNVTTKRSRQTVQVKKPAANLAKVTNQTAFLERYLRGTGRTLSEAQARANYGISNLSARMSELRQAGLKVLAAPNSTGKVAYSVSARSVTGSRARVFNV